MAFNAPILGPKGVGMMGDDGKLTVAARDAFTAQVLLLLAGGNKDGKGPKISSLLPISFPPVPGPKLVDPDRLLLKPTDPMGDLFWFDPSPLALLMSPVIVDPEKAYQKIIVTNLYEPIVKMLNVNGNLNAPPLFDPTCFFDVEVDIPQFLIELNAALLDPKLQTAFDVKYKVGVPKLVDLALQLPKLFGAPPVPTLPIPPIPDFDFIIFPDLFLGLLSIPIEILKPDVMIDLIKMPPSPPALFLKIGEIALGLLLKLLEKLGMLVILPKLLVATMIVILQNMVSMMVCDMIGMILGTGQLVKLAGTVLGLS